MERTIVIKTSAFITKRPDIISLGLSFKSVRGEYDEALRASSEDVLEIKKILKELGVNLDDLKTIEYKVDAKYESYKDKNGNYRSKFIGYEYKQRLELKMGIDNKLLGKILYRISLLDVNAEISLSYDISNVEVARAEALAKACLNARKRAEILAKASGCSLGRVLTINNLSIGNIDIDDEYDLGSDKLCCYMENCSDGYDIDINPNDVGIHESVEIVYEII